MKITPLSSRIVLKKTRNSLSSSLNGIENETQIGKVVATNKNRKCPVKVGDVVIFNNRSVIPFKSKKDELFIINQDDLLAKITSR